MAVSSGVVHLNFYTSVAHPWVSIPLIFWWSLVAGCIASSCGWSIIDNTDWDIFWSQHQPIEKKYIFFYRQLDFPFEPGVANEILENEPKSCLSVA